MISAGPLADSPAGPPAGPLAGPLEYWLPRWAKWSIEKIQPWQDDDSWFESWFWQKIFVSWNLCSGELVRLSCCLSQGFNMCEMFIALIVSMEDTPRIRMKERPFVI